MKTKIKNLSIGLAVFGAVITSSAQGLVNFTYNGGIQGQLGSQTLNDFFTLTLTGNTANETYNSTYNAYIMTGVTGVMTDVNFHTPITFTDPLMVYTMGLSGGYAFVVSTADFSTFLSFSQTGPMYDLTSALSLNNVGASADFGATFNTSAGVLTMQRLSSGDSFSATPVATPEPSTFALAGLGGASLLLYRRRKSFISIF